jgi:hypothetical protein
MTANKIYLKVSETIERNCNFGKFSESGRHAVAHFASLDYPADYFLCDLHSLSSIIRKRDLHSVIGNRSHI